jgi:hypothetical protein
MMTAKAYAYLLTALVILWPLFLLLASVPLWKILFLIALSAGLWVLVWRYCSSPEAPFLNGLGVISATMFSGCADLTIIYLLPFLVIVYLIFVVHTLIGLVHGRQYTQEKWIHFTDRYYAIMVKRMKK